ncbi:hypothetical protein [Luteimonas sp. MC1828]|uniref:hypothetical protein n=1 Tax=Luteimonas sp. MC1828 TaxID=2799787 RepID=UPI0018F26EC0|nr:hypothetical protein [Luteimonas sp. MC1828]MBJ7575469.1 hypothetical protein [Luteimonas sp. MC1828]
MDLKDFVSQTLVQIATGVKDAQAQVKDLGGTVNPSLNSGHELAGKLGFLYTRDSSMAPVVQFDVALTVAEGSGTKGGIGVFAGAVNLGSSGQSQSEQSSVSRVKFAVPLTLPAHRG